MHVYRLLLSLSTERSASDRFSFLVEELSTVSTIVASHGTQIAMLADELTLTRAAHAEEIDGRVNVENLHRLMILGGPYLEGADLQERLKQQVTLNDVLG